jgi:hypothetical protein
MKVHGLAYHNKKDVCFTFSSDSSKRRKFHRAFSGRQRWVSTHRVYLHYGIVCALFIRMERVHSVPYAIYIPIGVGFYCFLSLTLRFLPTYLKSKDIDSNMIPAPFLCK